MSSEQQKLKTAWVDSLILRVLFDTTNLFLFFIKFAYLSREKKGEMHTIV